MNMKHSLTPVIRALALCALAAFALNTARGATTWYWDGSTVNINGASDNITTGGLTWLGTGAGAGNWDNGTVDGPIATGSWATGDSAVFGGSAVSETVTAGTLTIGNMTFGQGADGSGTSGTAYTISGSSTTITLSSGTTITANTPTTIGCILGGSGSLTVAGAATLSLSGVNTYSGGTTIGSGSTLTINGSGKLAAAGAIINNGTFNYNSSAGLSLTGVISGGGAVAVGGTGALTLNKAETYSGTTTIGTGSTLTLTTGGKLGNGTYSAAIVNNGTLNYNNPASATLSGVISGSGSLSVNPSTASGSLLYLRGANSYTGKTSILLNGQVIIYSDTGLGTPPTSFVANQLTMNYGFLKASATITLSPNFGITLGNSVPNLGGSIQTDPGFTLTIAAPIAGPNGFISGSALATYGYGTNLLTGHSTYTGATGISTGRLLLGANGALPYGTSVLMAPDAGTAPAGAIFDLGGYSQTIGPLSTTNAFIGGPPSNGIPTIVLNGALTILQTNIATVFIGQIIGSGSLTLNGNSSGMLTLSNYANTYTGLTTINGGTLDVSATGASLAGDVTVNSGALKLDNNTALSSTATLTMDATAAVNLNYSGTQTIAALYFGATSQATGLWGAVGNAGATYTDSRFTGSGLLLVCPTSDQTITAAASACAGSTNNTASVTVTPGATYVWSISNGTITAGGTSTAIIYTASTVYPVTLNCVVTSPCGAPSAGGQNVNVPVNICGLVVQSTNNVVYDPVNGATITGTGVMGADWSLNASSDVTAPLPWPIIQYGTITASPFTVTDPNAILYSQQFYYLTNSP
jgi:autotransporter-associated beta strand protein